jgi:hypothetical protein
MWNPHQEGFTFRQIISDSVAQARYKTFLTKHSLIGSRLIPYVHVTTRFASYQDCRAILLADFYDGSRLRQLVLEYIKHLTINPSKNTWLLATRSFK